MKKLIMLVTVFSLLLSVNVYGAWDDGLSGEVEDIESPTFDSLYANSPLIFYQGDAGDCEVGIWYAGASPKVHGNGPAVYDQGTIRFVGTGDVNPTGRTSTGYFEISITDPTAYRLKDLNYYYEENAGDGNDQENDQNQGNPADELTSGAFQLNIGSFSYDETTGQGSLNVTVERTVDAGPDVVAHEEPDLILVVQPIFEAIADEPDEEDPGDNNPGSNNDDDDDNRTRNNDDDANQVTLTINIEGEGSVPGFEGRNSFDEGTIVILKPTADEDYEFSGWTGDTDTLSDNRITMDDDYEITANFDLIIDEAIIPESPTIEEEEEPVPDEEEPIEELDEEPIPEAVFDEEPVTTIEDDVLPQAGGIPLEAFSGMGLILLGTGGYIRKRRR